MRIANPNQVTPKLVTSRPPSLPVKPISVRPVAPPAKMVKQAVIVSPLKPAVKPIVPVSTTKPTVKPVAAAAKPKAKKASAIEVPASPDAVADLLMAAVAHSVDIDGRVVKNTILGLPLDAPALMYLFQSDVLPLRHLLQLSGPPGAGKTTFMFDLMRRFCSMWGGFAFLADTEGKFNAHMVQAVLQESYSRFKAKHCATNHEWRSYIFNMLYKAPEIPNIFQTPFIIGVDSISAKIAGVMEKMKKNEDLGPGYGYAHDASANGQMLGAIQSCMAHLPVLMVFIAHQVLDMGDKQVSGSPRAAGGRKNRYLEMFEMHVDRMGAPIDNAQFRGYKQIISSQKSSAGEGKGFRKIITRILWSHVEDAEGNEREVLAYDWDWAFVNLLLDIKSPDVKGVGYLKERLRKFDINVQSVKSGDLENLATAKSMLGIKDPISWSEMGRAIRENADVMERVKKALTIHSFAAMKPGENFMTRLNDSDCYNGRFDFSESVKLAKAAKKKLKEAPVEED